MARQERIKSISTSLENVCNTNIKNGGNNMKKTVERIALGFLIREVFHICIAISGVSLVLWFFHQLKGMGW